MEGAVYLETVWTGESTTTCIASMNGAITSGLQRSDVSMSGVLRDRVGCRKWYDGHCKYERCDNERCTERRREKEWCTEKPSGPRGVSRELVEGGAMREGAVCEEAM